MFLFKLSLVATAAFGSFAAYAATPVVRPVVRVESGPAVQGASQLVKDPQGRHVLVRVQDHPKEPQLVELVALDTSGKKILSTSLFKPKGDDRIALRDVAYDAAGDLRVILASGKSIQGTDILESINLSRGTSARLIEVGKFTQFGNRLRTNNRSLAVVTGDLDKGPNNQDSSLLRILDEDTGAVIFQQVVSFNATPILGTDSKGALKLLLWGYEVFNLLDVTTGQIQPLLPPRVQPSVYPGILNLSIGKLVQIQGANGKTQLLDQQELFNGKVKIVREYAKDATFSNGDVRDTTPARFVFEKLPAGLRVTDLKTQKPLGLTIPKSASNVRVWVNIQSLLPTPEGVIAVVAEPKHPNSYIQGTILTYYNLRTLKVLRTEVDERFQVFTQLVLLPDSRAVSVEQTSHGLDSAGTRVVDLSTNQVMTEMKEELIGSVLSSTSSPLLGVTVSKTDTCVVNLLDSSEKTCAQDPLLTEAAIYGYDPVEIRDGSVTLPLTKRSGQYGFDELGYIELKVD